MKKVYKKPEIMFESFASSVNIAGDCEVTTNTPNSGYCGLDLGGGVGFLFLNIEGSQCTPPFAVDAKKNEYGVFDGSTSYDGDDFDTLCYHVPTDNNLFNS